MIKDADILQVKNTDLDNNFVLVWSMTLWCNYRCPYCPQAHSAKYIPQEILEKRAQRLNEIIDQIPKDKGIHLQLIGGEITYYDLAKILTPVNFDRINTLWITTNFSRDNDYFEQLNTEIHKKNPNTKLKLIASYHDQAITLNDFSDKVIELQHRYLFNLTITCFFVINNDLNCVEVYDTLQKHPDLRIGWGIERNTSKTNAILDDEHKELIEYLKPIKTRNNNMSNKGKVWVTLKDGSCSRYQSPRDFINDIDERHFFVDGAYCTSGLTTIRILEDGNIVRSQCALIEESNYIGNIDNDEIIKLPQSGVICKLNGGLQYCPLCAKVNVTKAVKEE